MPDKIIQPRIFPKRNFLGYFLSFLLYFFPKLGDALYVKNMLRIIEAEIAIVKNIILNIEDEIAIF